MTLATTIPSGTLSAQGYVNTNIPFSSLGAMMTFILTGTSSSLNPVSYFDEWETLIVSINTTTNGILNMLTAYVDPTGLRSYVPFKQVRSLVTQFWQVNSQYVTNVQLKFRLPQLYLGGNTGLSQASIDPTKRVSRL
jgi:hypothetical protein